MNISNTFPRPGKLPLYLLVCSVLVFPTSRWATNPADSFGFSPRYTGMAGGGGALVRDWSSAWYNLAGMSSPLPQPEKKKGRQKTGAASVPVTPTVPSETPKGASAENSEKEDGGLGDFLKKTDSLGLALPAAKQERYSHQLGVAYLYQLPFMSLEPRGGSATAAANGELATSGLHYGVINAGLAFDLRTMVNSPDDLPIHLGAAISLTEKLTAVNDVSGKNYNFMKLGREAERINLITGLSMQAWKDRLSLGAGTQVLFAGEGRFKMNDILIDVSEQAQVPPQETKLDLSPKLSPVTGAQFFQPLPLGDLSLGLSWRGEIYMELDPLLAEARTLALDINLPLKLAVLDFYSPHTVNFSSAWHWREYRFLAELEYQHWSGFQISSARAQTESAPDFKNIFIPRLAAEGAPLRRLPLDFRLGYAFIPAFTPDQPDRYNYLDNSKNIVSAGVGYTLPANIVMKVPTRFDLAIQTQIWNTRDSVKNSPTELNPSYSYGGNVLVVVLGASWSL